MPGIPGGVALAGGLCLSGAAGGALGCARRCSPIAFAPPSKKGNVDQVPELFHEHAAFRSPVLFRPYEGRDQVLKALRAAEQVLGMSGRFRYVHQLEDPYDRVAILEFATEVDGKQVEGI